MFRSFFFLILFSCMITIKQNDPDKSFHSKINRNIIELARINDAYLIGGEHAH